MTAKRNSNHVLAVYLLNLNIFTRHIIAFLTTDQMLHV